MSNVMTTKRTEQSSRKGEAKVSRRGPASDGRQRIVEADRAFFWKTFCRGSTRGNGAQRYSGKNHDRDLARDRSGDRKSGESGGARHDSKECVFRDPRRRP